MRKLLPIKAFWLPKGVVVEEKDFRVAWFTGRKAFQIGRLLVGYAMHDGRDYNKRVNK
jgi:hypothetical protein